MKATLGGTPRVPPICVWTPERKLPLSRMTLVEKPGKLKKTTGQVSSATPETKRSLEGHTPSWPKPERPVFSIFRGNPSPQECAVSFSPRELRSCLNRFFNTLLTKS